MLKNHISKLLNELELDANQMSEKGETIVAQIDEHISLTFRTLSHEGFTMLASIGKCPDRKIEEIYTTFMLGNLFGNATNRAILGLDGEGKYFTLELEIPHQVTYQEFYSRVETFLNNVEFWQNELEEHEKGSEEASSGLLY